MAEKHIVAVAALIYRQGRVLAMRRSPKRDAGPGLWETLSGRVLPGEEPLDAVRREILEESGLQDGVHLRLEPRPVEAYSTMRAGEPMVLIIYRAEYLSGEVRRSEEHDAHAWFTPEEFAACSSLHKLVKAVQRWASSKKG
jgi:8-oxo-dGTP pyrophosphatase MutT (NUDIX family)